MNPLVGGDTRSMAKIELDSSGRLGLVVGKPY
jgi:hypothetical protein